MIGRSEHRPCLVALRDERSLPSSERGPVDWVDMVSLRVECERATFTARLPEGCRMGGEENSGRNALGRGRGGGLRVRKLAVGTDGRPGCNAPPSRGRPDYEAGAA